MKKKTSKLWIGIALCGGILVVISFLNLQKNAVYFYTPDEMVRPDLALPQRDIKVGGMVEPGSVQWDRETISLKFVLTDFRGARIFVSHRGVPPDMFKENGGVVVEGRVSEDRTSFVAHRLFVKHSQEYKIPHSGDPSQDRELLKASFFGS